MIVPNFSDDLSFISRLGDNPNTDNGLSSAELKEEFDKASKLIQQFINTYLVPAANSGQNVASLPLTGGTMTGPIAMSGKKITGLGTPTADTDAVTKAYADAIKDVANAIKATADAALPKSGGTMTGAIAMGGKKITGLGAPTDDADAATKKYADDIKNGAAPVVHHHQHLLENECNNTDINTLLTPGMYWGYTGMTNAAEPEGMSYFEVKRYRAGWLTQKQVRIGSDGTIRIHIRAKYLDATWTRWRRELTNIFDYDMIGSTLPSNPQEGQIFLVPIKKVT